MKTIAELEVARDEAWSAYLNARDGRAPAGPICAEKYQVFCDAAQAVRDAKKGGAE